jgi:carbonic anhydrase
MRNKKRAVVAGASAALLAGAGIAWAADWDHKAGGTDWPEEFTGCDIEAVVHQSPIDVQEVLAQPSDTVLDINYADTADVEIFNNSHTVQADVEAGSSITVTKGGQDKTYNLLQFHWHTPSENEFSGYDQDAEIHFVHQNADDGSLAVVGVLYDTGAASGALQPFFNAPLPDYEDPNVFVDDLRLADIVPSGVGAYNFAGSLTTPPCDAGAPVDWYVIDAIDSLSQEQMGELRALFSGEDFPSGNARVVQRVVVDDLTTVAVQ